MGVATARPFASGWQTRWLADARQSRAVWRSGVCVMEKSYPPNTPNVQLARAFRRMGVATARPFASVGQTRRLADARQSRAVWRSGVRVLEKITFAKHTQRTTGLRL